MLTTLIISIVSVLLTVFSLILPSWALPSYIVNSFTSGIQYIYFLNEFLPLNAIIKSLLIIFSFEVIILSARLVVGLISIVRGGGKIDI